MIKIVSFVWPFFFIRGFYLQYKPFPSGPGIAGDPSWQVGENGFGTPGGYPFA